MKTKILLSVLACGIAGLSIGNFLWAGEPVKPGDSACPENVPPVGVSDKAGRFQIATAGNGAGGSVTFRVDTATGKTWKLESTPVELKRLDGSTYVEYLPSWAECLEPEVARWHLNRAVKKSLDTAK